MRFGLQKLADNRSMFCNIITEKEILEGDLEGRGQRLDLAALSKS